MIISAKVDKILDEQFRAKFTKWKTEQNNPSSQLRWKWEQNVKLCLSHCNLHESIMYKEHKITFDKAGGQTWSVKLPKNVQIDQDDIHIAWKYRTVTVMLWKQDRIVCKKKVNKTQTKLKRTHRNTELTENSNLANTRLSAAVFMLSRLSLTLHFITRVLKVTVLTLNANHLFSFLCNQRLSCRALSLHCQASW